MVSFMKQGKFKHGDIVTLDGDIVREEDPNRGITGKVTGYSTNPFEICPIVETFGPFKFGDKILVTVDFLSDDWWTLSRDECRCESLL
nr:MAG TPA: hypothetical protein [Siphoviridae sp. ctHdl3]